MTDPAPQLSEAQQWVKSICDVTGWNVKLMAGRAAKLGKLIRDAGGTWQELEQHFGQMDDGAAWWYYRDDWRGKRGERPNQAAIMERWGAWTLATALQFPAAAQSSKWAGVMAWAESASDDNT